MENRLSESLCNSAGAVTSSAAQTCFRYRVRDPAAQSTLLRASRPDRRRGRMSRGRYNRTLSTSRPSPHQRRKACSARSDPQKVRSGPRVFFRFRRSAEKRKRSSRSLPFLRFRQNGNRHRRVPRIHCAVRGGEALRYRRQGRSDMCRQWKCLFRQAPLSVCKKQRHAPAPAPLL